jgi:hypothetical protein
MNFDPDPQDGANGETAGALGAAVSAIRHDMTRLLATARNPDACGIVLWSDIQFQTRVATVQAELDALEYTMLRAVHNSDGRGDELARLAAFPASELAHKVAALTAEAVGPHGMARYPDGDDDLPGPAEARGVSAAFELSRATAIDGDSQRETVAAQYLKL